MKKYNPVWKKYEPVERVYINYDRNNNLTTHEAIIPNYRKIKRSRQRQVSSVSLTRLTSTSIIHRKSYYDGTLDWEMLGFNMCC